LSSGARRVDRGIPKDKHQTTMPAKQPLSTLTVLEKKGMEKAEAFSQLSD
jgi:hypothetical protein